MKKEPSTKPLTEKQKIFCRDNFTLIQDYLDSVINGADAYINQDQVLFKATQALGRRLTFQISDKFNIPADSVCAFACSYQDKTNALNGILTRSEYDHLYFIESNDAIKIGRSGDPIRRMQQLQSSNAEKLRLIKIFYYKGCYEYYLHWIFQHIRLNGEWFEKSNEIYEFIELVERNSEITANYGV